MTHSFPCHTLIDQVQKIHRANISVTDYLIPA